MRQLWARLFGRGAAEPLAEARLDLIPTVSFEQPEHLIVEDGDTLGLHSPAGEAFTVWIQGHRRLSTFTFPAGGHWYFIGQAAWEQLRDVQLEALKERTGIVG